MRTKKHRARYRLVMPNPPRAAPTAVLPPFDVICGRIGG